MVAHPRTAPRPDQLRPLNQPRPVVVLLEHDRPIALLDGAREYAVERVQDRWCIDDEWWREPIERHYYRLALEGGLVRTVYHDRIADAWFEQEY